MKLRQARRQTGLYGVLKRFQKFIHNGIKVRCDRQKKGNGIQALIPFDYDALLQKLMSCVAFFTAFTWLKSFELLVFQMMSIIVIYKIYHWKRVAKTIIFPKDIEKEVIINHFKIPVS
jgi:hypothetical protein